VYDDRGVPHIFATNEDDAYRVMGYVVARDRLFQMDLQTRATKGTLSEPAGARLVSLAEHYRRESLEERVPVTALMRKLAGMLEHVAAVVVSLPPDDASFGWDYPRVRALLARRSIPHALLTGDPACALTAADLERIRSLLATTRPEASCG
jgi:hypothetical protein